MFDTLMVFILFVFLGVLASFFLVRPISVEYPSKRTSYRVYVLHNKKFWVEGDKEFPETVKGNVSRIKLSKGKIYALVKCNLQDGTYEYIFYNKGERRKYNDWKAYLNTKELSVQDFPSPKVMDKIYPYMWQQRKKQGIRYPVPMSSHTSRRP